MIDFYIYSKGRRAMKWKFIETNHYRGAKTSGDLTVPKTTRWNKQILIWFFWKREALFRVDKDFAESGYKIGFHDVFGNTMICTQEVHTKYFRVRIGHEPCVFFAVCAKTESEVPLALVGEYDMCRTSHPASPMF